MCTLIVMSASGCTITITTPGNDKDNTQNTQNTQSSQSEQTDSINTDNNQIDTGNSYDNTDQQELIDYINNGISELSALESSMLNSYNSVSTDNYTDDETMYNEIKNNTIVYARDLQSKAFEIAAGIKSEKVKDLHDLYIDFASGYFSAMGYLLTGLENSDREYVLKCNECITEANKAVSQFREDIVSLMEELNVEIN